MVAAMGGIISQPDIAEMRTEVMQVPVPMVPMIMGRGAEHVKKIQEVYGVNIQVEKDNNSNRGSVMRDVTIRGREEMVAKAKEVIQTMVQTGNADVIRSMQTSRDGFEMIPIAKDRVGLIVGTRGATVQDLQKRTGTTIQVAREGDAEHPDMRNIVITGPPDNVREAKRQVLLIADVGEWDEWDVGNVGDASGRRPDVPYDDSERQGEFRNRHEGSCDSRHSAELRSHCAGGARRLEGSELTAARRQHFGECGADRGCEGGDQPCDWNHGGCPRVP